MRFAGSLLVNLPCISILASWQKWKVQPQTRFFENSTSLRGCNKIPYPCSSECASNAHFTFDAHASYTSQSNQRPRKPWFLHNYIALQTYRLCPDWTSSCLLAAFTLLCALRAFRFAMWPSARKQIGDTSREHRCANTTKPVSAISRGMYKTCLDSEQEDVAMWSCSSTKVLIVAVFPSHILVDKSYQRKPICSLTWQGLHSVWLLRSRAIAKRQMYAKDRNDVSVVGWRQLWLWAKLNQTMTLWTPLTTCGYILHTNLYILPIPIIHLFLCCN